MRPTRGDRATSDFLSGFPFLCQGSAELVGLGSGFDHVRLVGEPVLQGLTEARVRDIRSPFGRGLVRRDDDGSLLGSTGDDLEQQIGRGIRHDDKSDFVDDK